MAYNCSQIISNNREYQGKFDIKTNVSGDRYLTNHIRDFLVLTVAGSALLDNDYIHAACPRFSMSRTGQRIEPRALLFFVLLMDYHGLSISIVSRRQC